MRFAIHAFAVALLAVACTSNRPPTPPPVPSAEEETRAVENPAPSPQQKLEAPPQPEAVEAPEPRAAAWAEIPTLSDERSATPAVYPSDKTPRFVIFGASWCGPCVAGVLQDAELARRFKGRLEVGVALREDSNAFARASMSRWLADVPVWTRDSTSDLAKQCRVVGIPAACLVEDEALLWRGETADGSAVIDAYLAGTLDDTIDRMQASQAAFRDALKQESDASRMRAVEALRGFAGRENSLAWNLVDQASPSPFELRLGLELAQDAVQSTAALDFAILDTYALALAKTGKAEEAARIGARVIAVCDAIGGHCGSERRRANEFIEAVR